ncbi:MAG: helix-turn-helix transcriptional regulator, partial [Clostridiales bacterium]|nr:helix-turn-helix transcriptional regulator [Clostridiales bacterium]
MTAAYDSIVKILSFIETRRYDKLSIHQLAGEAYLSASHLQRVFRLASGQSLMHYARGRKLAHSLGELLYGNDRIIDVAMRYGFQHEQSYIRAFYKEFGCTPGEAREASRILPIRARIAPEDFKSLEQGLLYGPKLVQVSSMRVVGKVYTYYGFDQAKDAPLTHKAGLDFCAEALEKIPGASEQNVYLGFCKQLEGIKNIEYIPCIQAKNMPHIPEGFTGMTVPPSLCVCFH